MKKIIAIGGSNSKESINKRFATYTANKIDNGEVNVVDLNDFDLPMYGIDYENEHGIPKDAQHLFELVASSDGLVISLAEHNGSYSAVFKNTMDWMSRINPKLWGEKPMLLLATSPGGRGGQTVLTFAANSFPHLGANLIAEFSLPSFYDNFSEDGLKDEVLNETLNEKIMQFGHSL
tara:strand:+ start:8999 stop:9529 length:531 start_codon:yes stop_codon:yes gene_type:complete